MANHAANGTVVDGIVSIRIEEWRLQYGRREANLVCRRVVVGVDGLWGHLPQRLVHLLVHALGYIVIGGPARDVAQVLVKRKAVVDLQAVVVFPLVGIANLDDEVGQLVLSLRLRGISHPRGLIDALCESRLQVAHEFKHAFLARLGEIPLHVHLAYRLAQPVAHHGHGAFPSRLVLL